MATKRGDRIAALIKDVEAIAKRLRADVRKRTKGSGLQKAADRLRKQAAVVAGYVEKYAHEIRMELEGPSKPAKRVKRKARPKVKAEAPIV